MQSLRYQSSPLLRRVVNEANPRLIHQLRTQPTKVQALPSSGSALQHDPFTPSPSIVKGIDPPKKKKKLTRLPAGKTSLRRVAVEAQTGSRNSSQLEALAKKDGNSIVTAIAVADHFDMDAVSRILRAHGFLIVCSLFLY